MASINDLYYVNKVKDGDIRAFSEIVSRYKNKIFNIVLRIVENREDAEDITQDVFVKVYKSLDKFKEESEFSTWVYRIAYNTTISEIRKRKLKFTSIETGNFTENDLIEDDFDVFLDTEKRLEYLNQALNRLPPDEVFLISLFYMEDKSVNEITLISGISTANVKVKLFRIRKKLALEMKKLMENEN